MRAGDMIIFGIKPARRRVYDSVECGRRECFIDEVLDHVVRRKLSPGLIEDSPVADGRTVAQMIVRG